MKIYEQFYEIKRAVDKYTIYRNDCMLDVSCWVAQRFSGAHVVWRHALCFLSPDYPIPEAGIFGASSSWHSFPSLPLLMTLALVSLSWDYVALSSSCVMEWNISPIDLFSGAKSVLSREDLDSFLFARITRSSACFVVELFSVIFLIVPSSSILIDGAKTMRVAVDRRWSWLLCCCYRFKKCIPTKTHNSKLCRKPIYLALGVFCHVPWFFATAPDLPLLQLLQRVQGNRRTDCLGRGWTRRHGCVGCWMSIVKQPRAPSQDCFYRYLRSRETEPDQLCLATSILSTEHPK